MLSATSFLISLRMWLVPSFPITPSFLLVNLELKFDRALWRRLSEAIFVDVLHMA